MPTRHGNVILILPSIEVFQILDGLQQRLESWRHTEKYLLQGYADDSYGIEECSDAEEAHKIAGYYKEIIKSIQSQVSD